jgi:hypothetical protein
MSTSRIISKVVLFSLVLALSLSVSWAGTLEGSTATARTFTDSALGQVMIFNGDFFNNGVTVTTFTLQDSNFGQGAKFVTPILFEETSSGVFVVRGIGTTDTVTPGAVSQAFAFGLVNGIGTTSSGLFTFGFIEAAVNSSGTQTTSSTGGVDLNNPFDGGTGVSGVGTNDWVFTPTPGSGFTNVALGTTFNIPGKGAGIFPLNNSTLGGFNQDRTYSANLNSAASGVPEPGTLTLFTSGAGLLLAGLLRFRRRS